MNTTTPSGRERDMEQRGFCRAEQSIFCFAFDALPFFFLIKIDALPFVCLVSVPFHRQMFTKSRRFIGKGLFLLTCKSSLVKNTEFFELVRVLLSP